MSIHAHQATMAVQAVEVVQAVKEVAAQITAQASRHVTTCYSYLCVFVTSFNLPTHRYQ